MALLVSSSRVGTFGWPCLFQTRTPERSDGRAGFKQARRKLGMVTAAVVGRVGSLGWSPLARRFVPETLAGLGGGGDDQINQVKKMAKSVRRAFLIGA